MIIALLQRLFQALQSLRHQFKKNERLTISLPLLILPLNIQLPDRLLMFFQQPII
jgi:hypothetical protein